MVIDNISMILFTIPVFLGLINHLLGKTIPIQPSSIVGKLATERGSQKRSEKLIRKKVF